MCASMARSRKAARAGLHRGGRRLQDIPIRAAQEPSRTSHQPEAAACISELRTRIRVALLIGYPYQAGWRLLAERAAIRPL
jgi:hypothetical protein